MPGAAPSPARRGHDVVAGLSLAAFVIPESLAYASLAGLSPVSGLYCYLVAGLAYAVFGSSRQLAVGPTSAIAIAVAAGIAAIAPGDPERAAALAAGIALLVGVIAIGGRYLGLANLAYFFSDPAITGFKTGAALYIASTQLAKLLGLPGTSGNFFERVWHVAQSLPATSLASLAVGAAAIVLFLLFERLLPGRPTMLVVVAGAMAASALLGIERWGVHLVGDLPSGLPAFGVPSLHLSDLNVLLPTAVACFLLAYSESVSVARSFALKHRYEIDPERELSAIGAANVAASLAHGFPVAGGMSQSAVNDMGGASSRWPLVICSAAVGLTLVFFTGLFRHLPEPVLAAIIFMAAKHLVKLDELRALRTASRSEYVIALIGFGGVLAFGPLQGLLLATLGAIVALIARAAKPEIAMLARNPRSGRFVNKARYAEAQENPTVLVLRTQGAWVYFNAEAVRRRFLELLSSQGPEIETVILDCSAIPDMDITAVGCLEAFANELKRRNIVLELAELRDDLAEKLRRLGAEAALGPIVAHRTIDELAGPGKE